MSKPSSLFDTLLAVPQDEDVSCVIMQMASDLFGSGVPHETENPLLNAHNPGHRQYEKGRKTLCLVALFKGCSRAKVDRGH